MRKERIFTHVSVDLDAVASVWAVKEFVPGMKNAKVYFRPANWDGKEMNKKDWALDIHAGGKGIKGKTSCFKEIIETYTNKKTQEALEHLIEFIDIQDSQGSVVDNVLWEDNWEKRQLFKMTGLNRILRAFEIYHQQNDQLKLERMSEIFSGFLELGKSYKRAEKEAAQAEILPGNKVALLRNSKESSTKTVLFSQGINFIVYVNGHNVGILRKAKNRINLNNPFLKKIVERADEEKEWFIHPKGFLFCRGGTKSPINTPTKVNPRELAETLNFLIT